MNCKLLCIAGIIFFITNVYVSFNADKTEHKKAAKKTFLKGLTMADKADFYWI